MIIPLSYLLTMFSKPITIYYNYIKGQWGNSNYKMTAALKVCSLLEPIQNMCFSFQFLKIIVIKISKRKKKHTFNVIIYQSQGENKDQNKWFLLKILYNEILWTEYLFTSPCYPDCHELYPEIWAITNLWPFI